MSFFPSGLGVTTAARAEFKPDGKGTKLIFTGQAAFLDGDDDAGSRERGTQGRLDQLGAALGR